MRGAFRLNFCVSTIYWCMSFPLSLSRAFAVFYSDQCGAKRALADKKGVFVQAIIASFYFAPWIMVNEKKIGTKSDEKNHLFGLCFYEIVYGC